MLQKTGFVCEGVHRRVVWQDGRESDLSIWAVLRDEKESLDESRGDEVKKSFEKG